MPTPLLGQKTPDSPKPNIHAENADLYSELEGKQAENAELFKQLAQLGMGLDPLSVVHTRIAALIESIFPSGTSEGQAAQIKIELNFEKMMNDVLVEVRRNAVTAQLQAGANIPPHMLEQMAKATGQHVPDGLRKHL